MKRYVGLLVVLGLLFVGACGDSASGGAIEDCDDVVAEGFDMLQDVLNALEDVDITDLQSEEPPQAITDLEQRGEELQADADALNCTDEELAEGLADMADDLEANNPVAQLILEQIQSEIESGSFFE